MVRNAECGDVHIHTLRSSAAAQRGVACASASFSDSGWKPRAGAAWASVAAAGVALHRRPAQRAARRVVGVRGGSVKSSCQVTHQIHCHEPTPKARTGRCSRLVSALLR